MTAETATTSCGSDVPAEAAAMAAAYFAARLAHETDPADVASALKQQDHGLVLIDARQRGHYRKAHLPGAINLPPAEIDAQTVAQLPPGLLVTYCWGPACNGATKAASRLAAHGRQVKEMIGGFEYWVREGWPTEGVRPVDATAVKPADLGLVC